MMKCQKLTIYYPSHTSHHEDQSYSQTTNQLNCSIHKPQPYLLAYITDQTTHCSLLGTMLSIRIYLILDYNINRVISVVMKLSEQDTNLPLYMINTMECSRDKISDQIKVLTIPNKDMIPDQIKVLSILIRDKISDQI